MKIEVRFDESLYQSDWIERIIDVDERANFAHELTLERIIERKVLKREAGENFDCELETIFLSEDDFRAAEKMIYSGLVNHGQWCIACVIKLGGAEFVLRVWTNSEDETEDEERMLSHVWRTFSEVREFCGENDEWMIIDAPRHQWQGERLILSPFDAGKIR